MERALATTKRLIMLYGYKYVMTVIASLASVAVTAYTIEI